MKKYSQILLCILIFASCSVLPRTNESISKADWLKLTIVEDDSVIYLSLANNSREVKLVPDFSCYYNTYPKVLDSNFNVFPIKYFIKPSGKNCHSNSIIVPGESITRKYDRAITYLFDFKPKVQYYLYFEYTLNYGPPSTICISDTLSLMF